MCVCIPDWIYYIGDRRFGSRKVQIVNIKLEVKSLPLLSTSLFLLEFIFYIVILKIRSEFYLKSLTLKLPEYVILLVLTAIMSTYPGNCMLFACSLRYYNIITYTLSARLDRHDKQLSYSTEIDFRYVWVRLTSRLHKKIFFIRFTFKMLRINHVIKIYDICYIIFIKISFIMK